MNDQKTKIEAVAEAIWDAKVEGDESPKWAELDNSMDRDLKNEIREMAKAAIKVCHEHR